jgi:PQQ-dependent catabolism-associated CXXCW motif protein
MPADAPWLPLPHEAIPGALWIPEVGMGEVSDDIDQFFTEQLAQETTGDLDRPIVIYCHERCWLSWNAAKRAIGYAYRNVHWFPEGIEGWRAAGFETATVRPRLPPDL